MLLAVLADSPLLENLALGKAHREVAIISNYSLSVNEIVEKEKSFKKKYHSRVQTSDVIIASFANRYLILVHPICAESLASISVLTSVAVAALSLSPALMSLFALLLIFYYIRRMHQNHFVILNKSNPNLRSDLRSKVVESTLQVAGAIMSKNQDI
uniref:Uncharacterized protein n=1 Tax=Rhizophagus irregularis (strain DAOM 181602 / DAOM 197198 / MUCL 43194) TaxID=747089 RepID=U9TFB1_RHIID